MTAARLGPVDVATRTEQGARENNEDGVLCVRLDGGRWLAALADGMGGLEAGERASRAALDALETSLRRGHGLVEAFKDADRAVRRLDTPRPAGTTLVAALFDGERVEVASVGDSRAYHRGGLGLTLVTRDHTVGAEALRAGEPGAREAAATRWGGTLTRSLGGKGSSEPDRFDVALGAGEELLLTSDGVHGALTDERMAEVLEAADGAGEAADALVGEALAAGSEDNASAVILRVPARSRSASNSRRRPQVLEPDALAARSRKSDTPRRWAGSRILMGVGVVALLILVFALLSG